MVTKSVELDERHDEWLDEHPEVNLSGFVRKQLDARMEGAGDG